MASDLVNNDPPPLIGKRQKTSEYVWMNHYVYVLCIIDALGVGSKVCKLELITQDLQQ